MTCFMNTEGFDDAFVVKIKEAENKIFISGMPSRENRHSLYGRVLLGYMLKKYRDIKSFSYRYGENGKPYLENEDIFFNISHSGDYILCTLSENETGCDIEKIREYNPKIGRRFFSAKEAELLDGGKNASVFARLWTLKESILKKEGTGIGGGLDTYCFADYAYTDDFSLYGCHFLCREKYGYALSVCCENVPEEPYELTKKEIEEYIDGIK